MDKNEIIKYIEVGSQKSICVDRRLLDQYPGYVRDITIMKGNVIKVDFNIHGYDEGGLNIKVHYDNFDKLLSALQEYLGTTINNWKNINQSGYYPTLEEEIDLKSSRIKFKYDFVNKTISLPLHGIRYQMPEGYWKDLADGVISNTVG